MSKPNKNKNRKTGHPSIKSFGAELSQAQQIVKTTLHRNQTFSSNGSGDLLQATNVDPSNALDWGDYSSTFDEFRVLGIRVNVISLQPNSTTVNNSILAVAWDDDSSNAPANLTDVQQYSTAHSLSCLMKHDQGHALRLTWWRPTSGGNTSVTWCDVANPSGSIGAVLFAASGLTASTQYLYVHSELFIEFRGRR